jgi:hypothetical protein
MQFFYWSAKDKIGNVLDHSSIANPQILRYASPQIANSQIFKINPQISSVCHSLLIANIQFSPIISEDETSLLKRSAPILGFHSKTL